MAAGPQLVHSSNPADLTGSTVGRYAIRKRLGSGGMGEVYLAEDTTLKRSVALKRMGERVRSDAQYRQRFIKEAERASRLSHPHIASLFDVLEHNGELFLVIEHIEGQTLRRRMRDPFTLEQFLHFAVQCADALEAAHQSGLVHRDIKPENIMLRESGQVKILDFGLAKEMPIPGVENPETAGSFGSLSGTPAYMSPEVLLELPPDARADIFSLGVVFYEVLTGKHPFLANTFLETSARIVRQEPLSISELNKTSPKELDAIIQRMMAKSADARYSSAAELAEGLRALQRQHEFPSTAPYAATRRSAAVLRLPIKLRLQQYGLWASLVLLLAVAAVAGWKLRSASRGGTLVPTPPVKQLAVLPFEAIGSDGSATAFSDGFSEVLAAKLAQLSDRYPVQVVPPSEVRSQHITSADQARKVFGVNLVLMGGFRKSGNTVRISYTLIDAASQRQLRGDVITADLSNPFAVEDGLIASVLNTLDLELRPEEREALRGRGTTEPVAYDFYLRGRGYLNEYEKPENVDNAISVFNHALELDKKYGLAYAGLGQAYWLKYKAAPDVIWVERARSACETAIKLADASAPAHDCLGMVQLGTGNYSDAVNQFRRALQIEATDDGAYRGLAGAFDKLGQTADAEKTYQRAIALRPNYWSSYNWLGALYVSKGRYPEGIQQFKKVVELAPDSYRGYYNLGGAYLAAGRFDDAIPVLERSVNIRPNYAGYGNLATAYFWKRDFEAAVRNNQQAVKLKDRDFLPWNNLAESQYWAGKRDESRKSFQTSAELARAALKVNTKDVEANMAVAAAGSVLGSRLEASSALTRALRQADRDPEVALRAAIIQLRLGVESDALESLKRAVRFGIPRTRIDNTPDFDSIRQKPAFQAILEGKTSS